MASSVGTKIALFLIAFQLRQLISHCHVQPESATESLDHDDKSTGEEEQEVEDLNRNPRYNAFATAIPAVIETTPGICSPGMRCGFQVYHPHTLRPSQPFISYCSCPEGTECAEMGQNMGSSYFYYKCRNDTGATEPYEIDSTTASENEAVQPSREERAHVMEAVEAIAESADSTDFESGKKAQNGDMDLKSRVGLVYDHSEL